MSNPEWMQGEPVIIRPYNQILAQHKEQLRGASRYALTTTCDPQTKEPITTARQRRRQLKTIQINASTIGDNPIIPGALAGLKEIFELVMWNVGANDLIWKQGSNIVLLDLPSFPAATGFTLGFNGNFDMPHWEIDNGQPLNLNLSAATRVTGFIRYRVQNGTY